MIPATGTHVRCPYPDCNGRNECRSLHQTELANWLEPAMFRRVLDKIRDNARGLGQTTDPEQIRMLRELGIVVKRCPECGSAVEHSNVACRAMACPICRHSFNFDREGLDIEGQPASAAAAAAANMRVPLFGAAPALGARGGARGGTTLFGAAPDIPRFDPALGVWIEDF